MNNAKRPTLAGALLAAALVPALMPLVACGGGVSGDGTTDDSTDVVDDVVVLPDANVDEWDDKLTEREIDYNAAFRTASLRLIGELPTLAQVQAIDGAGAEAAKKAAYEGLIDDLLANPLMGRQMFYWWRDTLKLGDTAEFDGAAGFAANLSVTDGDYRQLLTAAAGQCGTFDEGTGTYTPGDCGNGAQQAGLLSHPGMMRQFFGNFAFRRVKWVQETFVCTKFPAETAAEPQDVGGAALYTGLFPFESVPSLATGRINFQDVSAVVCANCHSTMNHIAPLFAYHDDNGQMQGAMSVPTPLEGAPPAQMTDYLTGVETTAWRFGEEVTDLPALGTAMAADPDIAACAVARTWNWAMGKGDIVEALEEVPAETIQTQIDDFVADGFKMKALLRAVFTSDDFVKF